jgi:hypothetical protein
MERYPVAIPRKPPNAYIGFRVWTTEPVPVLGADLSSESIVN